MKLNNLIKSYFLRFAACKQLLVAFALIIFILIFSPDLNAKPPKSGEVQAVFIYKFLKFIEWPQKADQKNITICSFGESEINDYIKIINGKEFEGRKIKVLKISQKEKLNGCKIIFFGETKENQMIEALKLSKENSILTISNKKGFLELGGIINFLIIGNKVNFEINFNEAKESGIKISSKLLRTAKRVIKE